MTDQHPRLVLGFRRRSLADLAGYDMHAKRAGGDRRHVDLERTHLNRSLLDGKKIGDAREAATDLVVRMAADNLGAKIAGLKKRRRKAELKALMALAGARGPMAAAGEPWDHKNEKPFFDGILSASPTYFAAAQPAVADAIEPGRTLTFEDACRRRGWDAEKIEIWVETARKWLVETFGDDLVDVRLDLDEQTPHIHLLGAPRVVDGKGRHMLSQRQHRVLGERKSDEDERESYERVLDEAAPHFAPLGIVRGDRRAALSRAQVEAAGELTVEALSPAEGRKRAAELIGAAAIERGEMLAQAEAHGEAIRREAEDRAESDVAFAAHRAEVLLGATDLVVDGHVGTREAEPGRLYASRSAPVADFSRRFAPTEHDDSDPPRGLFAAIRGAGVWQHISGLAERLRAVLKREKAVEDREAEIAERARQIAADRARLEADRKAAAEDRVAAAEERADAAFERAEAAQLLERAVAAGDRVAAAELARMKMRARPQREQ
jgi:hypothetical protein